jgi:large subunit ribosomal protein L21
MAQAVVQIKGSQYFVRPGESLLVDRLDATDKQLSFNEVLLYVDGEDIRVGQPFVKDMAVTAHVDSDLKGDKIRVFKYKAKSRYRKTIGFRHSYTKIIIDSVGTIPAAPVLRRPSVKKTLTSVKKKDKV